MTSASVPIEFEPVGRRGSCPAGGTLLEAARHLGVDLVSICGGEGSCGRCVVQVVAGEMTPPTRLELQRFEPDAIAAGYRLACQAVALGHARIRLPPESLTTPQRIQVEGLDVPVAPEPTVTAHELRPAPPSMVDVRGDDQRICDALHQAGVTYRHADTQLLRHASRSLRELDWHFSAVMRHGELIAVTPANEPLLGLAVDVGTTKLAAYLVNLSDGRTLASGGLMNPQIAYGEDVITRIARVLDSPTEAERMQALVVEALNQLAHEMAGQVGAGPHQIVDSVVVGNTAMHHLLLRLPVSGVALSPYVPAVARPLDVKARELGLNLAPGACVHFPPNIAGFVGADHVAMILATGVAHAPGLVLALDIGTNTEVCLVNQGEMSSVSCASGPAFEGAHIKHGMRAAQGAIEHLRIAGDRVDYQTIGGAPPVGICGSGVLDGLAQLYRSGIVNRSGKMLAHARVRGEPHEREFVLVAEEAPSAGQAIARAISITQRDVRELQLAKGAMRTGIEALLQAARRNAQEIDQVVIAGAFGSYIDVQSAITIGMLPDLPLDRFRQVGNAAGTGARLCLISQAKRNEAQQIARRVRYMELASVPNFQHIFAESMYLGQ